MCDRRHQDEEIATLQLLYERGARVDALSDNLNTHLQHAAFRDGVVRALLDCGASVSVSNGRKETALHWACRKDAANAVAQLLRARADPDAPDYENKTSFHVACMGPMNARKRGIVHALAACSRESTCSDTKETWPNLEFEPDDMELFFAPAPKARPTPSRRCSPPD